MPNYEQFDLCGFQDHLSKPCMKEDCRRHNTLICCCCGAKATRVCDHHIQYEDDWELCGEKLCDKCEHIGNNHIVKQIITKKVKIKLEFVINKGDEKCNLDRMVEAIVKNAIEQNYRLCTVHNVEVKNV